MVWKAVVCLLVRSNGVMFYDLFLRENGYMNAQEALDLLDATEPRLFNSAIMEFGALYCTPRDMACEQCPISVFCLAKKHGTAELLPIRKPRPQLKDRWLYYTIYITRAGETLIHQRTGKDIWLKLWEFPLEELTDSDAFSKTKSHIALTHLLSHQRLHIKFLLKETDKLPEIAGYRSINWQELDDYAFSKPTLIALSQLNALEK